MAVRATGNPDRWTAVADGQRLRELRRQQALSQAELAKLAGVSAHTVSKLERQPASLLPQPNPGPARSRLG